MSRSLDKFETRIARTGGEIADMLEVAREAGATPDEYASLMAAAQQVTDAMRAVRRRLTLTEHDRLYPLQRQEFHP